MDLNFLYHHQGQTDYKFYQKMKIVEYLEFIAEGAAVYDAPCI